MDNLTAMYVQKSLYAIFIYSKLVIYNIFYMHFKKGRVKITFDSCPNKLNLLTST